MVGECVSVSLDGFGCFWLAFVIVRADGRLYATVYRQPDRACGGSEGPGRAGSSCEPSHGGFVGCVGSLWFVRVSVVVGHWDARVYGVWCVVAGQEKKVSCTQGFE